MIFLVRKYKLFSNVTARNRKHTRPMDSFSVDLVGFAYVVTYNEYNIIFCKSISNINYNLSR